jgi:excisionase family DNA binding protein
MDDRPDEPPAPLLATEQAAHWSCTRPEHVLLVARGELRARRLGRQLRFRPERLLEWAEGDDAS